MRNLKRLLTMVMAIAMLMSLMVVGAGATSFNDDKDITHKDAVDKMVSLNIINGRDGNFDPTGIVTRAEMAKMICVALNGGNDPKLSSSTIATSTFADTKGHWAEGYIEYCVNMGIAAGLGNNTFGPDQKVTASQAAKMLLVALGYDAAYEKFTGPTWALNSNKVAMQKGLYDDIQGIDPNAPMTRDSAAQMIHNFCDAKMVKYEFGISGSTGGAVTGVKQAVDSKILVDGKDKYETILNKYYKLNDDTKGIMTDWSYDNDKKEYKYTIDGVTNPFITKNDFSKFFGQNVQVYYKDKNNNAKFDANNDEVYDITSKDSKVVLAGLIGDMDEINTGTKEFKYDNVTYKLTNDSETIKAYNTGVWTQAEAKDDTKLQLSNISKAKNGELAHYNFAVIDNSGDDKGDIVVIYPYTVEKITYVDSKGASTNNATYKFDDCEIYKDIAKNDWVKIVDEDNAPLDRDTLTEVTAVTGEISSIKNSTKIVVDGKTYKNADGATGDLGYKIGNKMELITLNGYIFNAKKLSDSVNRDKILLVTNADEATVTGTDAGKQQIKVLLADGTKKVVKTDKIDDADVSTSNSFKYELNGKYNLNTVYTYSIDKDGNYELTPVKAGTNESYDIQKDVSGAATTLKDGKVTASSTTFRFADDAVIFYFNDKKKEFKATTGKNVSTWNETDVEVGSTFYANETDGFMYTQVAFMKLDNAPSDKDYKYGYIVADPELVKGGDDYYYQLKIWDGKENITVKAESTGYGDNDTSSSASVMARDENVKKGTPVRYKVAGDGIVEMVTTLAEVESGKTSVNAVIGYTDGKNAVAFQSEAYGADAGVTDLKITSDTIVVRYSSEDKEGQTGNGITVAKETAVAGVYYQNCYVVSNSDNEVEALVIDKDSKLGLPAASGLTGKVAPEQVRTQTKLHDAFANAKTITVTGSYAPTEAITVDAGETLIVDGNFTSTNDVTVNGTLEVKGDFSAKSITCKDDATISGNVTLTAASSVAGALTVNGTLTAGDAITGAGTMTVKAVTAGDYEFVMVATTVTDAFTAGDVVETLKAAITFNGKVTTDDDKAINVEANGVNFKGGIEIKAANLLVVKADTTVTLGGEITNASFIKDPTTFDVKVTFAAGATAAGTNNTFYAKSGKTPGAFEAGTTYQWNTDANETGADTGTDGWKAL